MCIWCVEYLQTVHFFSYRIHFSIATSHLHNKLNSLSYMLNSFSPKIQSFNLPYVDAETLWAECITQNVCSPCATLSVGSSFDRYSKIWLNWSSIGRKSTFTVDSGFLVDASRQWAPITAAQNMPFLAFLVGQWRVFRAAFFIRPEMCGPVQTRKF